MNVLTLEQVSYKYKGTDKKILKDINIRFETGKLYAIMGKSGAGKTTLLSLISGLEILSDGTILYNGQDMRRMNRDDYRAKNIGVIFQGFNLLTNTTAVENITLSMNISGSKQKNKREYAYALLEQVGIERETADRKVLKLSGGEQQRVGIARALAHDPDIIIADEPTGNLDDETSDNILSILKSLAHESGKCVIIVTHSKSASKYADELWGLNKGNLLFVR